MGTAAQLQRIKVREVLTLYLHTGIDTGLSLPGEGTLYSFIAFGNPEKGSSAYIV